MNNIAIKNDNNYSQLVQGRRTNLRLQKKRRTRPIKRFFVAVVDEWAGNGSRGVIYHAR